MFFSNSLSISLRVYFELNYTLTVLYSTANTLLRKYVFISTCSISFLKHDFQVSILFTLAKLEKEEKRNQRKMKYYFNTDFASKPF